MSQLSKSIQNAIFRNDVNQFREIFRTQNLNQLP